MASASGSSAGRWRRNARGRELPGDAQEQAHLHVRRLAVGRYIQRRRVLMTVDEDQAGPAVVVAQAGDGAQQHRALTAIDDREATGGQRCTHVLAKRLDQRQQGRLVHQPRAGGTTRVGGRQREIGCADVTLTEGTFQAGVAQRLGRASLVPNTTEAVEGSADQLNARRQTANLQHRLAHRVGSFVTMAFHRSSIRRTFQTETETAQTMMNNTTIA